MKKNNRNNDSKKAYTTKIINQVFMNIQVEPLKDNDTDVNKKSKKKWWIAFVIIPIIVTLINIAPKIYETYIVGPRTLMEPTYYVVDAQNYFYYYSKSDRINEDTHKRLNSFTFENEIYNNAKEMSAPTNNWREETIKMGILSIKNSGQNSAEQIVVTMKKTYHSEYIHPSLESWNQDDLEKKQPNLETSMEQISIGSIEVGDVRNIPIYIAISNRGSKNIKNRIFEEYIPVSIKYVDSKTKVNYEEKIRSESDNYFYIDSTGAGGGDEITCLEDAYYELRYIFDLQSHKDIPIEEIRAIGAANGITVKINGQIILIYEFMMESGSNITLTDYINKGFIIDGQGRHKRFAFDSSSSAPNVIIIGEDMDILKEEILDSLSGDWITTSNAAIKN